MKAKLTRLDGTVIELEGDEKDVTTALSALVLPPPFQFTPTLPYIQPYYDCVHEYPEPWYGSVPLACKKCGQAVGITDFWITTNSQTIT